MKKFLAILVSLLMILSICGCSTTSVSSSGESASESASESEEAVSESTDEEPAPADESVSEEQSTTSDESEEAETESSNEDNAADETNEAEQNDDVTDSMTTAQKNAYQSAKSYLTFMAFSRQGLIDQLSSEYGDGYEVEDATFAIETLEANDEVDWNEQAYQSAKSYLSYMAFSRQGLIDQLTSEYGERFESSEAEYAVGQLETNDEVDWNEQAYESAKSYLSYTAFSRQGLIDQLTSEYGEQFESDEAEYAINKLETNSEVDWNEQAYLSAKNYLEYSSFSLDGLIEQLESEYGEQFTHEQAVYGAEKAYSE